MTSIKDTPASEPEAQKLISEIQNLIKVKGLKVDLTPQSGYELKTDLASASGCTGCTLCSCTICW